MEPVINPWVFYLIDIANTLKGGSLLLGIVIAIISLFCNSVFDDDEYNEKEKKSAKKKINTGTIILIIGIVLFIILPSSETVMKMVIAKNVTYDTVDAAKDVVAQVYNDILALFQK